MLKSISSIGINLKIYRKIWTTWWGTLSLDSAWISTSSACFCASLFHTCPYSGGDFRLPTGLAQQPENVTVQFHSQKSPISLCFPPPFIQLYCYLAFDLVFAPSFFFFFVHKLPKCFLWWCWKDSISLGSSFLFLFFFFLIFIYLF